MISSPLASSSTGGRGSTPPPPYPLLPRRRRSSPSQRSASFYKPGASDYPVLDPPPPAPTSFLPLLATTNRRWCGRAGGGEPRWSDRCWSSPRTLRGAGMLVVQSVIDGMPRWCSYRAQPVCWWCGRHMRQDRPVWSWSSGEVSAAVICDGKVKRALAGDSHRHLCHARDPCPLAVVEIETEATKELLAEKGGQVAFLLLFGRIHTSEEQPLIRMLELEIL